MGVKKVEVEDMIEEADQLFEQAEAMIVKEPVEGLHKFQAGVTILLKAFFLLWVNIRLVTIFLMFQ